MDVIASRMHHADVVMEMGDTFFEAQCTAAKLRLLCIRTKFEANARALGFSGVNLVCMSAETDE
ncbi:hypothetical protein [Paenirhodobacter populi]|uniref:hypothetical protein n=1 Tax=Paenirhodobacter populi TaxID=2306993 RepID=UPI0019D44C71